MKLDGTWKTSNSKFHNFIYSFRLPDYRKSFMTVDNKWFFSHLSRIYMAQIMEQFHVLVRLTTVLGNQYGYNFKSPGSNFCEPDLVSNQKHDICRKRMVHLSFLLKTTLIWNEFIAINVWGRVCGEAGTRGRMRARICYARWYTSLIFKRPWRSHASLQGKRYKTVWWN